MSTVWHVLTIVEKGPETCVIMQAKKRRNSDAVESFKNSALQMHLCHCSDSSFFGEDPFPQQPREDWRSQCHSHTRSHSFQTRTIAKWWKNVPTAGSGARGGNPYMTHTHTHAGKRRGERKKNRKSLKDLFLFTMHSHSFQLIFHWRLQKNKGATFTCLYIIMLFVIMDFCDCKILKLI